VVIVAAVFWTGAAGAEYQAVDLQTLGGWGSIATAINGSTRVIGDSFTIEGDTHAFLWDNSMQWMQDLETLGGTWSSSFAINAAGQVVGDSETNGGSWHAFIWDSVNGMRDLQSLGGGWSHADAINSSGKVAGDSNDTNGDIHAFFWDGAQMHDLETLGGDWSYTGAVNAAGQVVGDSLTGYSEDHAFLWQSPGPMRDLDTLPGGTWSYAIAVNTSGQVTGSSDTGAGEDHAFLWTSPGPMQDLGTLGGTWSYASAINAAGQVVGVSQTETGEDHVFLWTSPGPMQDLGTLGGGWSYAFSLNDCGQVVGGSQTVSGDEHAFVWDNINGMQDLGTLPDGASSTAYDINIWGEIVGRSLIGSGDDHAVLFLPDAKITQLLKKYYLDILGRAADPCGLAFWRAHIELISSLGISKAEGFLAMAKGFFNSAEYINRKTSNDQYVTDLYRTFLNRDPDSAGRQGWVAQLQAGLTRNGVLYAFAYCNEFRLFLQSIFGLDSSRPEHNLLNDFYRGFLGRFPDTSGYNMWLGIMRNAQCTGAQEVREVSDEMTSSFINSAEYALRSRTNSQYVEDLYDAILRRGADPGGFSNWLNVLNSGTTRDAVLDQFLSSQEFQLRVQQVISAGCLP